jgi:uncharacterized protein YkwD
LPGLNPAGRGAGHARRALVVALAGAALAGCAVAPILGELPGRVVEGTGPVAVDADAARRMIASYREAHGLGAVDLDPALVRVARRQADSMARANRLGHAVSGDLSARLAAEGLRRGAEAENVSAGYPSFERALLGWERSPRHNDNLLYRPIRRIGIAAASAPGTRYKTFWALVMTD